MKLCENRADDWNSQREANQYSGPPLRRLRFRAECTRAGCLRGNVGVIWAKGLYLDVPPAGVPTAPLVIVHAHVPRGINCVCLCMCVGFHAPTCWPTATRHPSWSGCQGRSRTFLSSPNKNKSTASAEASWSWALSWLRYWLLIKYMIFAREVEQFETEATKLLRDDVKCRTVATWVLMEQLAANTWDV